MYRYFFSCVFFVLFLFLWGCHKPPTKLKKLLEKYPELLKQDTIKHFDTLKIERIKIETIIIPKTDTVEIERLILPIGDSVQKIIVKQNIYQYLEKLRQIDTTIIEKDLTVWVYTDSLGNLRVFAMREERAEIKERQVIRMGYKIENKEPPWKLFFKILGIVFFALALSLLINWKYGK